MSELDFLLNRKKRREKREEKNLLSPKEKKEDTPLRNIDSTEKRVETTEGALQHEKRSEESTLDSTKKSEELKVKNLQNGNEEAEQKTKEGRENTEEISRKEIEEHREDNVEAIMKSFLNRDPKIGVWSYPAFLVLQYLYNTKPGFKMSKVAKEALEYGLKKMYPELFEKAEKISQLKYK